MPQKLEEEKFQAFLGNSLLHELQGKKGVLVVGRMGAGKSTFIAIQQGAIVKQKEDEDEGGYQIVKSDTYTPKTSDGMVSQTLNVSVFVAKDGTNYFDTAGLNENRGPNERTWTTFSTSMTLSLLSEIQAVVVVMNYTSTFNERGAGMADLAECIESICGGGDQSLHFYNSMIFVMTGCFDNGFKVRIKKVITKAEAIVKTLENKRETILKRLEKLYPKHDGGFSAMQNMMGSEKKYAINWKKVEEHGEKDKTDLENCQAGMKLAQQLVKSCEEGRVYLSDPDGRQACQDQREKIDVMIKQTPSIGRVQLKEVVSARKTHNHDVIAVCSGIAAKCVGQFLREYNNTMEALSRAAANQQTLLKSITASETSWQGVAKTFQRDVDEELDTIKDKIAEVKREVQNLKESKELKTFHREEIRKSKSGFWCWFAGKQWAEQTYRYNGPVEEYSCLGSNFQKTQKNLTKNEVDVYLASSGGYDLHVDVIIKRFEKDLPATQERLKVLQDRIQQYDQTKEQVNSKRIQLSAVTSKEALLEYVFASEKKKKEHLQDLQEKRKQKTGELFSEGQAVALPTWEQVMSGLHKLLNAINDVDKNLISNLDSGTRSTIDEFVNEYKRALSIHQQSKNNKSLMELIGGQNSRALWRCGSRDGDVLREVIEPVTVKKSRANSSQLSRQSSGTLGNRSRGLSEDDKKEKPEESAEEKERQSYLQTKVNPLFEILISQVVIDKPDNPVPLMIKWLRDQCPESKTNGNAPEQPETLPRSPTDLMKKLDVKERSIANMAMKVAQLNKNLDGEKVKRAQLEAACAEAEVKFQVLQDRLKAESLDITVSARQLQRRMKKREKHLKALESPEVFVKPDPEKEEQIEKTKRRLKSNFKRRQKRQEQAILKATNTSLVGNNKFAALQKIDEELEQQVKKKLKWQLKRKVQQATKAILKAEKENEKSPEKPTLQVDLSKCLPSCLSPETGIHHIKCPNYNAGGAASPKATSVIETCPYCKKVGHTMSYCPKLKDTSKRISMVDQGTIKESA